MPAAVVAKVLQGGTVERTWTGQRDSSDAIMSGSVCLVNARTGEGAWTGAIQPVCLQFPMLLPIATCSCNLDCALLMCIQNHVYTKF